MDAILIYDANRRFRSSLRSARTLRDRQNPLENLLAEECRDRYRFYPETIDYIAKRLAPSLRRPTKRSNSLNPINQVLICLEYLASGCFYRIAGDIGHVSKGVVCKTVHAVVECLCELAPSEICFPADETLPAIQQKFFEVAGIPCVTGLVDGCLIEIKKPGLNTDDYMCRKDYAAINTQVMKGNY
jgi:hypothetical protein